MSEWAKLSELKAGDVVRVTGFTCLNDGEKKAVKFLQEVPYVECSQGKHFLDGQLDENGRLVGVTKVAVNES